MKPASKSSLKAVAVAAVLCGLIAPLGAAAQGVADFYGGKTITLMIGYSAGGGYDTYARTVARHMGKHIPGNPNIVAKNRPGAGSMTLANELYNILPKDGTTIGIIGRGLVMEPLFGTEQAKFDASKFNWLGSANNEVSVCVSWHTSPVKTVEDLMTMPLIVGGTGPGADTDTFPKVMNNVIGTKLKLVTGYPGGNDILLAMERGEVDGRCGYSWSSAKSRKADWLKKGKMRVLVQMSTAKHPDLPDVPFIMDLAKTEKDKQILSLIFARQVWGRPFLAPPDVPEERVAALQAAFMATMADADFLADAKKQRLEINAIPGSEIAELIADLYASPSDIVAGAVAAAEKTGKIEISKAVIPVEMVDGVISKVANGGRQVSYTAGDKKGKVSVSGSRTTVTIGGQKANRKKLQAGMSCAFSYQGEEAKEIPCK